MKVSVVIPEYNEEQFIIATLQTLNRQDRGDFEVIVVDNGSEDGTGKIVENFQKKANYPLYVISEQNPGVAYARKKGMDEVLLRLLRRDSGFKHTIAVTDADTLLPPDWIRKIITGSEQYLVGGLAGTHEASAEVEKRIETVTGIRNYFNFIPTLIEFLAENNLGVIKMSGPNSAFTALAYATGRGIRQEYDEKGHPRLSEVDRLGKRVRQAGYTIAPMKCRVIKNRRRELFEIINEGENSYFPENYAPRGRFNVIREDERELLEIALKEVQVEHWREYRQQMITKVLKNFLIFNYKL